MCCLSIYPYIIPCIHPIFVVFTYCWLVENDYLHWALTLVIYSQSDAHAYLEA
jgi:hypothetical protein